MKNCFRKCCYNVFCCGCCAQSPLNIISEQTMLLPRNEATKGELETEQLFIYGSVPSQLRTVLLEGKYGSNPVKKIVCGKYHSLILLTNSRLIGFGLNDFGQLGLPLETKEVENITELHITIPNLEAFDILDIAAGDEFSLVLIRTPDNQNKIIKFGTSIINKYVQIPNMQTQILEKLPENINGNINKIIAFEKRKIFCTETNEIYLSGCDFNGMEIDEYVLLKKFDTNITNIFLQKEGCLVQDVNGDIFALGDNSYRELGYRSGFSDEFKPFRYKFDNKKIKKLAVGARHILILLDTGELYCMGDNSENQCCATTSTCGFPNKVEINNEKIVDCYAGYNHNLVITESGSVYTWGNTDNGKLGYLEDKVSQEKPKEILWMKIRCINHVCLGSQITIIVTGKKENAIVKEDARNEPNVIVEGN